MATCKDFELAGPRITMEEASERKTQIGMAFKEMQVAYGEAITTIPLDPEKNLWANEQFRILERTIS